MRNVIAFEERGEDAAGAEGVGVEGDEEQDRWGERVVCAEEVRVEVRDEVAREVHFDFDAPLPMGAMRVLTSRERGRKIWCAVLCCALRCRYRDHAREG